MSPVPPSSEPPGNGRPEEVDGSSPSPFHQEQVPLESDVPLSQSLIWQWQREFYSRRGLRAWTEDTVPQFITNNPFVAEIYARIVFSFLSDCMALDEKELRSISPENPLRILELGAGPGRFAYLFLKQMTALLRANGIAPETVRYCMTDCSESLIQTWRTNSYLSKFVESRILHFELLEAGAETKSMFVNGKGRSASQPANGPLVLIANYVFDSLPQDAFVIKEGQIFEALVTTTADRRTDGDSRTGELSRLKLSYKNASISPNRYSHSSWHHILETYRNNLPACTVLFPSVALQILQELGDSANGGMLAIVADKGFLHESDLSFCQGPPAFEFHTANCFSQTVNFDAISKCIESLGGEALVPEKHFTSLSICAFLSGRPGTQFPVTKTACLEAQRAFGPDDLFTLLAWLNAHMEEMSVPQIVALLRLSRWDPTTLMRLFPVLARQIRTVSTERDDLRNAVLHTWANHFPVSRSDNVLAFYCGVILLELRFLEEAFLMFQQSQDLFGRSAATSYNLGLCCSGLGRSSEALAFVVEACHLDPTFEPALVLRRKLECE